MKGGVHLSIVPKLNVSGIKGLRLFFQGKTNVNEYAIVCILDIFNTAFSYKKALLYPFFLDISCFEQSVMWRSVV